MAAVSVGDIWKLRNSERLGLVVFVRAGSPERPEDLRVVPIYTHPTALQAATHRDLVVPSNSNSLNRELLVASWNARGLDSTFLDSRIGKATTQVVEAARAAEMSCIIPGMDLGPAAKWLGARPKSKGALATAIAFQDAELEQWNALVAYQSPREEVEMYVVEQVSGLLKRYLQSTEAALGVPITHSLEGKVHVFYGGIGVPTYSPAPPSPSPTASRTAPNGAVLVSDQ